MTPMMSEIKKKKFVIQQQPLQLFPIALLLLLGCRGRDALLLIAPSSSSAFERVLLHWRRTATNIFLNPNGEHNNCNHGRYQRRQRQRQHHKSSIHKLNGGGHLDEQNNRLTVLRLSSASNKNIDLTISNNNNNESMDTTKKASQMELLLELENKFNYQGRISSKIMSHNPDKVKNNDEMAQENQDGANIIEHRCALITILGMPNMGKSTLLNALLSESLAIVTSRPQTTRHAILGVLTTPFTQLCVTDTPGIIDVPAYKLQMGMMDVVKGAVRGADLFLVVTDVYSGGSGDKNDADDAAADEDDGSGGDEVDTMETGNGLGIGEEMLSKLRISGKPVIVCVNKVDLASEKGSEDKNNNNNNNINKDNNNNNNNNNTPTRAVQTIQKWRSVLPNALAILPTCAAHGPTDPGVVALRSILLANDPSVDVGSAIRNLGRPVPGMFASISSSSNAMLSDEQAREIIPLGPPLYHPDFFTDRTDRFCASELIRETLFQSLGKELPYCCEVRIETFDESRRYDDEEDAVDEKNALELQSSSKKEKKNAMIRIGATILVERDSQKGIVVGKGGTKIKDVGIDARKKLEEFYGVKVFLDLRVKVDKNWRNDAEKLKKYGYM